MKKVFIQIRQWILGHRKRLIYGALAFLIGQICFFWLNELWFGNEVLADDTQTQTSQFQSIITKHQNFTDFIYKFIYVLAYPIIFLAAKLLDNSFVYWEIFWFDAVLRQLRNIIKNMANFWLWFLFVYKIFAYLITNFKGNNPKENPKRIITRALIAWIWIQASWFIMWVLIDISTILIYGIWWLPISILNSMIEKDSTSVVSSNYNPNVLKTVVSLNVNDLDNLNIYLTNYWSDPGEFYISECETYAYKHGSETKQTLILAPKMIYYRDGKWMYYETDKTKCSYRGQVYWFNKLYEEINWPGCSWTWCEDSQLEYNQSKTKARDGLWKLTKDQLKNLVQEGVLLEIWNAHVRDWIVWWVNLWVEPYWEDSHYWLDIDNQWMKGKTSKLSEVIQNEEKTNSYVWVFTLLYASLLRDWEWVISDWTDSKYVMYLNSLLKVAHILAIIIPLVAAMVVFMMRIWIIWMAIVLSPMIVLLTTFGLLEKIDEKSLLGYFKPGNLIWIIFTPAIICFAISMSTVLVTIIEKINTNHIETNEEWILWWLIKMDIAWLSIWVWKLIIAVIWVAITWFLVWAAVKSSKLWESELITTMESLAKSGLWSIPLVPIPTKDWVDLIWANTAFWLWGNRWLLADIKSNVLDEFGKEDEKTVNNIRNLFNNKWESSNSKTKWSGSGGEWSDNEQLYLRYNNHLFNDPTATNGDWTLHEFDLWNNQKCKFWNLTTNYQKQIIEDINKIKNVETRKKFGSAKPMVTVGTGDDTIIYEFNNESKYQAKSS